MAVIKTLLNTPDRAIPSRTETAADYSMDDEFFSIWSYRNGDIGRKGN